MKFERACSPTALLAMTAAIAVAYAGCLGGDGPPRVPVAGEVTFQGAPIESGSILFIPNGETRGPRAGAKIERGRYSLAADRGPVVGDLRVEIRADRQLGYDITEPTESVRHIGEPVPPGLIPPEYNDQSILTVKTSEHDENRFDFHLPSGE